MSRARLIGGVMVALSCAALCAGSAGAVKPKAQEVAPVAGFELSGTNGYTVTASFYFEPGRKRGFVGLAATRGQESVGYRVSAKVTEDSVHADLGRLGRIDLVLHRSGEVKTVTPECFHHQETYEAGSYEGVFEFNGEGGFTQARATQAEGLPGVAIFAGGPNCDLESYGESSGPSQPGARLRGLSYAGGRNLKFQFNKNRASGKTLFSASLNERRDGIRIYRQTGGTFAAGAFHYDPKLRSATLDPPSPFSGSARISRDPNSVSPLVTGDLKLTFPGRTVQLTGPAIHVSLAHAKRTAGDGSSASITFGSN